jgi:hypothetical protein
VTRYGFSPGCADEEICHGPDDGDVQHDDSPEGDPERHLPRLVPELTLGQDRTRPSAEESQQVQPPLGHPPPADSGPALVQPVGGEAGEAG